MSRSEQGECASGLRGETPEWHQFGNALAHGFDDAPAASHCAATHRQVAADNHPIGNGVRFHESAGDKSCGDDAHAFLSIIGAMAEAVASRREQLQTAKPFIDFLRALHADDPTGSDGDTHSKKHADERGEKNEQDRLGPSAKDERFVTSVGHRRTTVATHQSVRGASGQAEDEGD